MREEGPLRLADYGSCAIATETAKKLGGATDPLVTSEVEGSRSRLIANEEEGEIPSSARSPTRRMDHEAAW